MVILSAGEKDLSLGDSCIWEYVEHVVAIYYLGVFFARYCKTQENFIETI